MSASTRRMSGVRIDVEGGVDGAAAVWGVSAAPSSCGSGVDWSCVAPLRLSEDPGRLERSWSIGWPEDGASVAWRVGRRPPSMTLPRLENDNAVMKSSSNSESFGIAISSGEKPGASLMVDDAAESASESGVLDRDQRRREAVPGDFGRSSCFLGVAAGELGALWLVVGDSGAPRISDVARATSGLDVRGR